MQLFSLLSLLALSTSVAMQNSLPRIPDREQRELDMWEDFWKWRREQNRGRQSRKGDRSGRHRDRGSDYDSDHEGRRRRRDGRERGHENDRENDRDERIRQPVIPINPDYPPSLPIVIDPIQILPKPSMPSIIEPYPMASSTPSLPYISSQAPSTFQYYEATLSMYYSSSILYTPTPPSTKKQIYQPKTNSTTDAYASTTIVTVPESTVRTKVTGRYRAMSNSAGNLNSNITGSISFVLIVLSSIFLLSLV